MPDASLVIVNFNSGAYLPKCIDSLQPTSVDTCTREILVVDSASPHDQSAALDDAESRGARVLRLETNAGYGGACNRGLAETSGRIVFLLNADVVACPRAIDTLVEYLDAHPEVGLAEPRTFLDDERVFRVPEFFLLTPGEVCREAAARVSAGAAERSFRRRLPETLAGWSATEPREQGALTGAFLAGRRETLRGCGGFDEGYPLAYEDWDLFRRLRRAGLEIVMHPGAEAIHYGHRSRMTVLDEVFAKSRVGRRRYLRRHHGAPAVWLDAALELGVAALNRMRRPHERARFEDLGTLGSPPTLALEGEPGPYLMCLALEPSFALTAGHFGQGEHFAFPERTWDALLPTAYYLRAFAPDTLAPRGAWHLRKTEA